MLYNTGNSVTSAKSFVNIENKNMIGGINEAVSRKAKPVKQKTTDDKDDSESGGSSESLKNKGKLLVDSTCAPAI